MNRSHERGLLARGEGARVQWLGLPPPPSPGGVIAAGIAAPGLGTRRG